MPLHGSRLRRLAGLNPSPARAGPNDGLLTTRSRERSGFRPSDRVTPRGPMVAAAALRVHWKLGRVAVVPTDVRLDDISSRCSADVRCDDIAFIGLPDATKTSA